MAKTIRATRAQVRAAQLLLKLAERDQTPVSPAIRAIAAAKPSHGAGSASTASGGGARTTQAQAG